MERAIRHSQASHLCRGVEHHLSDQNPVWSKAVLGLGPCAIRHEHPGLLGRIAPAMGLPPAEQRRGQINGGDQALSGHTATGADGAGAGMR